MNELAVLALLISLLFTELTNLLPGGIQGMGELNLSGGVCAAQELAIPENKEQVLLIGGMGRISVAVSVLTDILNHGNSLPP